MGAHHDWAVAAESPKPRKADRRGLPWEQALVCGGRAGAPMGSFRPRGQAAGPGCGRGLRRAGSGDCVREGRARGRARGWVRAGRQQEGSGDAEGQKTGVGAFSGTPCWTHCGVGREKLLTEAEGSHGEEGQEAGLGSVELGPGLRGGLLGQLQWDPLERVGGGLVAPRLPSSPLKHLCLPAA